MENHGDRILNSRQQLEQELAERLTDGPMENKQELAEEKEEMARRLLPARYEIRIQTALDPIILETKRYRQMAKELDGRYDRYLNQAQAERSTDSEPEDK